MARVTDHPNLAALLATSALLGGCAAPLASDQSGWPAVEEPPPRALSEAETAEWRDEKLLGFYSRVEESLHASAPLAARPAFDSDADPHWESEWAALADQLVGHPSPEARLHALIGLADRLKEVRSPAGFQVWRTYLLEVVAIERLLLDAESRLARQAAPPIGSVHAAARRRMENFMAEGPSVISAREGRISHLAASGGVPTDPARLQRAHELAAELRHLGFYIAAAEPADAAYPLSRRPGDAPSVTPPPPTRAIDPRVFIAARDAAARLQGVEDAGYALSADLAATSARTLLLRLDQIYLVRGERMFAPAYMRLRAAALADSPPQKAP